MAWWPEAIRQPVAQCSGTLRPIAVCLHHQAGSGNPAPVYASRNVSAHFWIPRNAQPVQHVDTAVRAWHGVAHNDYSIGVETEGCGSPPHADPLTEHQLDCFARLMRWANQTHGIPLRLSEAVTEPGLNYHRCKGGPPTGCPCDERLNSRPEILRRAGAATTAPPSGGTDPARPTTGDRNMILTDVVTGGVWVCDPDSTPPGAVFSYDGAPYCGGTNNAAMNAAGWPVAGIDGNPENRGGGYVIVLDAGAAGGAEPPKGDGRYRRYRFPRNGSGIAKT